MKTPLQLLHPGDRLTELSRVIARPNYAHGVMVVLYMSGGGEVVIHAESMEAIHQERQRFACRLSLSCGRIAWRAADNGLHPPIEERLVARDAISHAMDAFASEHLLLIRTSRRWGEVCDKINALGYDSEYRTLR